MPLLGATGGGSAKGFGALANLGYFIKNSLRFRASASAYLSRTLGTPTAGTKYTWSAWVKRGAISSAATQNLFTGSVSSGSITYAQFFLGTNNSLGYQEYTSGVEKCNVSTSAVFRDPSAWYHIVLAVDTTQATASDRVKLYVNSNLQTLTTSTSFVQNEVSNFNKSGNTGVLGAIVLSSSYQQYFDGYMTEINFIDGQQLTPSSFGKTDPATGQWIPRKFAGTYGTNGFYLKFADASAATAAAIGKDSSPNGNNWTPNNISVTAGTTYDAMIDSPTLSAAASNYCVMSPVKKNSAVTITSGNLNVTASSAYPSFGTIAMDETNGYYAEFYVVSVDGGIGPVLGVVDLSINENTLADIGSTKGVQVGATGTVTKDGTTGLTGLGTYGIGSIVMIAYKASKVWVGVNGTWWNSGNPAAGTGNVSTTSTPINGYTYGSNAYNSAQMIANFGQRPFQYSVPSGFKALNTFNLP
jgi:hypothetical protein